MTPTALFILLLTVSLTPPTPLRLLLAAISSAVAPVVNSYLAHPMLLLLLLTAFMTPPIMLLLLFTASMAPQMLLLLLLTAYLAPPFVSALVNSLPDPSTVAPIFKSLPCPNRTVSPAVNSLPGPPIPLLFLSTALWPLQWCLALFLTASQFPLALLLNVVHNLSGLQHCQVYQACISSKIH